MRHFGYWIFGKDMYNVKLENLKKIGVTDLFLNYYAFNVYGKAKVVDWIKKAKAQNINVHVWVQCFYDGEWHNPKTMNTSAKLKEIKDSIKISVIAEQKDKIFLSEKTIYIKIGNYCFLTLVNIYI